MCLLREDGAVGGVNTVIDALCTGLQQRGWGRPDVQALRGAGPAQWWRAARGCDVLVATNAFRTAHVARLLGAVLRKPVVTWVHGPLLEVLETAGAPRLQRARLRWLHRGTARFVFVSEHARRSMAAFLGTALPEGRARVIPNPLPFDAPAAADLRPPPPSPDGVVEMGFVGRLSPEKEPARLLDLLRSLPERFRLTVVGDGPLRAMLEAAGADLVERGRLAFAGERPRGRTLSPEWRLTVLTSRYEGSPVSALESVAAGIPFVAPALPAFTEAAPGPAACLLARDATGEAMARTVQDVLSLPPARLRAALESVRARHAPDRFVDAWCAALQEAAGRC